MNYKFLIGMAFIVMTNLAVAQGNSGKIIPYPELFSIPATAEATDLPPFLGDEAEPRPLPPVHIPPNPFLEEQGRNGLHGDNYNTDVLNYPGPLGIDPQVSSRRIGTPIGTCPTVVFTPAGHVVTVCIGIARVRMFLMDPHSLEVLAEEELPLRAAITEGRFDEIFTDSSGGGYFHVDNYGRVLIGPANKRIETWEAVEVKNKRWEWQLVSFHDLSDILGEGVHLQDAITDYYGRTWFTTGSGLVGYVNEITGQRETFETNEFLQNSLVVDPGDGTQTTAGTYIVTVEALYKLRTDADGKIYVVWRSPYLNDGGQGGLLSSGSGTTPTAFGDNDDLIAIADNSAQGININVYKRDTGAQICQFNAFGLEGATENSPIGYGNDVVLENNAGYPGPLGNPLLTVPGLTRVHVREDYSGCDRVWETQEFRAQTTPRLSTATGLIYTYVVKEGKPILGIPSFGWYFSALDWETGEMVYEIWVGSGPDWNNVLDPVTIGPDGTAYVGTLSGLMSIRDGDSGGKPPKPPKPPKH